MDVGDATQPVNRDPSPPDGGPQFKKARVQVEQRRPLARGDACNACRSRKVRCTGERPTCSNCTKRTLSCVYSDKRYMLSVVDPVSDPIVPSPAAQPVMSGALNGIGLPSASSNSSFPLLPISADMTPLPMSISPHPVPMMTPQFIPEMFQFPNFLPMLGGSPTGLSGQTMPPEYADIDLEQLLHQLEQDIAAAASATTSAPALVMPAEPELTGPEQEHFIWLYFSNQRRYCLEMHFATFWARFQSEDPSEQPHQCLLNAMYLITAWASPLPALRDRRDKFYKDAYDSLRKAVAEKDRLLDAARAGYLISVYLYSATRFNEAATIAGMTYSIAILCGLHNITHSRFNPAALSFRGLLRETFCYLPSPQSQIELADRIYTFWSIFMLDRCSAISQDWPVCLGVDRICTPLPRPWSEYEAPGDHLDNDETLFDVMQGLKPVNEPTDLGQMIKILEILYRCSATGISLPHLSPSAARYDAVWGLGEAAQREKAMLTHALDKFTEQLPPALKSVQMIKEGKGITTTTGSVQFMIGGAQMLMHDTNKFGDRNELALAATRRMLGVMHLTKDDDPSMDAGLLVIMIWAKMGRILIREMIRLEDEEDLFSAAQVDAEISTVINALNNRGINLAKLQACELDMLRKDPEKVNPGCRKQKSNVQA